MTGLDQLTFFSNVHNLLHVLFNENCQNAIYTRIYWVAWPKYVYKCFKHLNKGIKILYMYAWFSGEDLLIYSTNCIIYGIVITN